MSQSRRIVFLVLPQVHVMDLGGPAQVFFEANGFGADYDLQYVGVDAKAKVAQGFWISNLEPLPEVGPGDWVVVPGIESSTLHDLDHVPIAWLRRAKAAGARICSICSAAWVLAHAGLLHHRRCATHWKIADAMQKTFPSLAVQRDRLFVRDGQMMTSAGVTSGIDMALAMVEEDHGPLVVTKVAREMVLYLRRDGKSPQTSIYLQYRTHLHPGVHKVQDWLMTHPEQKPTLEALSKLVGMSPRNLTRVFRRETGVSLKSFATKLKLEVATNLLQNPGETVEHVASQCGFADARQLRRLWKQKFGVSPSVWKADQVAEA